MVDLSIVFCMFTRPGTNQPRPVLPSQSFTASSPGGDFSEAMSGYRRRKNKTMFGDQFINQMLHVWNIYLQNWLIYGVNVYMEHLDNEIISLIIRKMIGYGWMLLAMVGY